MPPVNAELLDSLDMDEPADVTPDLKEGEARQLDTAAQDAGKGALQEAKVEPKAEPQAPAKAEPDKAESRTVPLSSLIEERGRLKAQIEERDRRLKELEEKQAQAQAEPAKVAIPEFPEDPKGYIDAKQAEALQRLEASRIENETLAKRLEQIDVRQQIAEAQREAIGKHPDVGNALAHIRDMRLKELELLFPSANADQRAQIMFNEEWALAQHELVNGRNPYETAYQLAKLKGYTVSAEPAKPEAKVVLTPPKDEPVVSAEATLSSTSGTAPDAEGDVDQDDLVILEQAQRERFGKR